MLNVLKWERMIANLLLASIISTQWKFLTFLSKHFYAWNKVSSLDNFVILQKIPLCFFSCNFMPHSGCSALHGVNPNLKKIEV